MVIKSDAMQYRERSTEIFIRAEKLIDNRKEIHFLVINDSRSQEKIAYSLVKAALFGESNQEKTLRANDTTMNFMFNQIGTAMILYSKKEIYVASMEYTKRFSTSNVKNSCIKFD